MAKYKRFSYDQSRLLPVSFHKQIQPGTFEYTLSYLIDNKADLSCFEELHKNDETGASAYNPSVLLKIILLAYSRGIVSSRDIARACEENVMFMALSTDTRPHFTAISSFISGMKQLVNDIFSDVLLYCNEAGLIGKSMLAIDGCKMPSNASKEWSHSRAVWSFYSQVIEYAKKWLNRRSQRKSYKWEKFKQVLEYTRIPKPSPTEKRRLHQCALR